MNDFHKKLKDYTSVGDFDLDKGDTVAQEVQNMYEAKMKKARVQFWWRFAGAAAITVYGALGIKYNTGWYVTWALFTAIVGVNGAMTVILWAWQIQAKLSIQRGMKELQLQIAELAGKESSSED